MAILTRYQRQITSTQSLQPHFKVVIRASILLFSIGILVLFAMATFPTVRLGIVPGFKPDSPDYAYGAAALLHGHYIVEWPGQEGTLHVPRYTPGFSIMLMPAVAIGGVESAVWVSYGSAILLAIVCAIIASRLSSPIGGLLVTIFVLLPRVMTLHAQVVMSDLPSATIIVFELLLLVFGRRYAIWIVAGALGGALVWIRPANAVLLLAGMAAASVFPDWRRRVIAYLGGAVPFLAMLVWWQLFMFGSPFTTGYQAAGASPQGGHELHSFFSLRYLFGAPYSGSNQDGLVGTHLPNIVAYLAALLGVKNYLALAGVGLVGAVALVWLARRQGRDGILGRFSLVVTLGTLTLYAPYFFQDPRFVLAPAVLLNLAAAVLIVRSGAELSQRVGGWLQSSLSTSRQSTAKQ